VTYCDVCNRLAQRLLRVQESGGIWVRVSRPEEPLEAILVSTQHHVNVQMWNTLADAVEKRQRLHILEYDVTLALTVDELTEETRPRRNVRHSEEESCSCYQCAVW